jgi:hypothetical protein
MNHFLYYRQNGVIHCKGSNADGVDPEPIEGLTLLLLDEPLDGNDWHIEDGALVPGQLDLRTLADHRAAKWEVMKRARAAAIAAPLLTPYGSFDTDEAGRSNIAESVLLVQSLASRGLPSDIDFTLADNTTVTLTAEQMTDVGLLLGAQVQAAHATGRLRRSAIDLAETINDLEGISWT